MNQTPTDGTPLDLQGKAYVLFFYPKDETRVCTKEACLFRDLYEDFTDAGATVIGVSADSDASHRRFRERHKLPFQLISDDDKSMRKAWAVKNSLAIIPGRVTFVVGPDGIVRHRFESATDAVGHVEEALQIVRRLGAS